MWNKSNVFFLGTIAFFVGLYYVVVFLAAVIAGFMTIYFGMLYFMLNSPNKDWTHIFDLIPNDRKWVAALSFVICGCNTFMRPMIKFFDFLKDKSNK